MEGEHTVKAKIQNATMKKKNLLLLTIVTPPEHGRE